MISCPPLPDRETREAYVSALLKEIGGLAGEYDLAEREVVSVFIGGERLLFWRAPG